MIKAGEMLIESTEIIWCVQWTDKTWGISHSMDCETEQQAREYALILDGKAKRATVMVTAWEDVA